jgi:hypothetical protein
MRLPASFGKEPGLKRDPEKELSSTETQARIAVPPYLMHQLSLTQRRIFFLTLFMRVIAGLMLLGLVIQFTLFEKQAEKIESITIVALLGIVLILFIDSLGTAQYAQGIKEFLGNPDNFSFLVMIKSYRSMWTKLGAMFCLLFVLAVAGIAHLMQEPGIVNLMRGNWTERAKD